MLYKIIKQLDKIYNLNLVNDYNNPNIICFDNNNELLEIEIYDKYIEIFYYNRTTMKYFEKDYYSITEVINNSRDFIHYIIEIKSNNIN